MSFQSFGIRNANHRVDGYSVVAKIKFAMASGEVPERPALEAQLCTRAL